VPYFHLVFTLPHDLNGLIGQCPRALYEMLFGAVSVTLTEFAANPRWLGGTPAFTLVLHTWKQDLGRHVHIHALVPGGALGADGKWLAAKRGFLFPIRALSDVFRGKFVAALKAARQGGKLYPEAAPEDVAWDALVARLYVHDWVVYAKHSRGGPEQVLDYLGRYTHRVAISNERIVGMSADTVSLRVRDWTQGNRRRTLSVPAQTFIERFLLHVLPKGFKRIRHYGLLGPAGKATKLAQARAALSAPVPIRVWWGRFRPSCTASTGTSCCAAPTAAKANSCRPRPSRRAGALAASAGPAVRLRLPSRFICCALGAFARQGRARPPDPVRAIRVLARGYSRTSLDFARTSLPVFYVAHACLHLSGRPQRHPNRLQRAPAGLQSP